MLFIFRVVFVLVYCIFICVFGSIYCLFSLRNPNNVAIFSRMFGRLAPLFGITIEIRCPKGKKYFGNAIYISNHQNNYDMITISNVVFPPIVTIGKKSLLWIPLFGILYWLSGNLLIDRFNHIKSYKTMIKIVNQFKKCRISIWMFPEGTRNRGRGLLPFKSGAFYIAIAAGVPIIPVCISNTSNKINLNRLKNGLVIIEMLPPIDISVYSTNQVRKLANYCHELMLKKIALLDQEVTQRENEEKI